MPVDQSLVGRAFPPTTPYAVSAEKIRDFVSATGGTYDDGPAPATFPIVLAFDAMNAFLEAESIDLFRMFPTGGKLQVERGVPDELVRKLAAMGHVPETAERPHGGGQAIWIDHDRGVLIAASEPRKDGLALGY